jgi:hypothetical protein
MNDEILQNDFNPLKVILPVLFMMLAISAFSQYYGQNITLPRYCHKQMETLHYLKKIVENDSPVGKESRRPYIIAAKLLFLLPKESNESNQAYLQRADYYLQNQCLVRQ